jgi:hypothetical protein
MSGIAKPPITPQQIEKDLDDRCTEEARRQLEQRMWEAVTRLVTYDSVHMKLMDRHGDLCTFRLGMDAPPFFTHAQIVGIVRKGRRIGQHLYDITDEDYYVWSIDRCRIYSELKLTLERRQQEAVPDMMIVNK